MELPFLAPRDLATRAKVELEVMKHPAIVAEPKDRWNSTFFGPSFLPAYEFMGNKRIETTDDMKGVKMRISGLNATALQAFGWFMAVDLVNVAILIMFSQIILLIPETMIQ